MKKLRQVLVEKRGLNQFVVDQVLFKFFFRGFLGKTTVSLNRRFSILLGDRVLYFTDCSMSGLVLSLLRQNVIGVCNGFGLELGLKGIGYRVWLVKGQIYLKLGFSHLFCYELFNEVIAKGRKNRLIFFGFKKGSLGNLGYLLRNFRSPDAYKGKGVQFLDEIVILKSGKQRQR